MDTLSPQVAPQSSFRRAGLRLVRSLSGKIGLILTLLLVVLAVLAPVLSPYDPATARDYSARLDPPSLKYWFGTDGLGRDMLTLVWYGIRISLLVSIFSVLLGLLLGTFLGLIAGYFRGWLETFIGWFTDILLSFPSILLAIAVVTVIGPSLTSVMIAVGVVQIPIFIRL
ncbi:MAG TPA: hypothetical protein V6C78_14855, partial [Crinalium sp.]